MCAQMDLKGRKPHTIIGPVFRVKFADTDI